MNNKVFIFIKNFLYTLTSNLVSMIVSSLVVLIVPKFIGVEEYGYWQLYMFYISYSGFALLGWNDGIYLRYGGKEYRDLDKGLFFSQFWMLFIVQCGIAILICIFAYVISSNTSKAFIYYMVAGCTVLINSRLFLLHILQATNRIKEYATITLMEKILYCSIIISLLVFNYRQYKLLIAGDLIVKLVSLLYAAYCCKQIVIYSIRFKPNFIEAIKNISVGIKLMLANIASSLIVGIVRFGIERSWGVSIFGKVSLILSVSNLMMLFINAVGLIMFPVLRRTNFNKLPTIYTTMRTLLMMLLLGSLILYYPLRGFLSSWLPEYADSLSFMVLVFSMNTFEGKTALLINTYLKTLRKEKQMLYINIASVILSMAATFLFTVHMKNLTIAVFSIVVLLALRGVIAELYLSKILGISVFKDILLELTMTLIFIITGWFMNDWLSVVEYAIAYIIYLLIKRKDISNTIKNIKLLMK